MRRTAEVKVKKIKPCVLAYIEHVGDYRSIPFNKYILLLYDWAEENKVKPGDTMCIFYDCPETTPPDKCRSEIAIPIVGKAKPGKLVKVKKLPAMKVAEIRHDAPARGYSETYRKLSEWITQNGCKWDGPSIEIYPDPPEFVGNEVIIHAEVRVPIKDK